MALSQLFAPLPHQPLGKYMPPMLKTGRPLITTHDFPLSAFGELWLRKQEPARTLFLFVPESQLLAERVDDNTIPLPRFFHHLAQN